MIRTEYSDDRPDDLDYQSYIRHPAIDLIPMEHQKIYNHQVILGDKLISIQETSWNDIILTGIMHHLK